MALRFDVLPQVLYQPKQAFEKIKAGATAVDGIIMALILMIVAQLIGQAPNLSKLGSESGLLALLGSLALGVISLALIGAVSAYIAGGKKDVRKTIGLVGYGSVLAVVQAIIGLAAFAALGVTAASFSGTGINMGALAAAAGIGIALLIVFFAWALWIYGSAVAAANETTLGRGVISYVVASILVGLVIGVISAIAVWLWVGSLGVPTVPPIY